ncbi:MAG: beta-N-acetylglucosaminidase domain-containing protein [Microthrixaceae bacterium]
MRCGLIEGFYGTPWDWDLRREVCRTLAAAGMDTYVYAPKDDPLHRDRWREPYPDTFLDHMVTLVEDDTLEVGFSVSPGLSIDHDDHDDRAALLAKFTALTDRGIGLVGLLLDDLPPADGAGRTHAELTLWLRDALPAEVELFLVPTHYTGTDRTPYLDELARRVPSEVAIGWTGPRVVNDRITAADAEAWSRAMDGRRPLLWDNTPVNDAVMADRLFTGPLSGRDPDLPDRLSGYLANPMVQARASVPPLVSAAAWWRGDDPVAAWADALGPARVLAEGCDGTRPAELAERVLTGDRGAADELDAWLEEATRCDDGGWGADVRPWVEQLRTEAAVARTALEVLRSDEATAQRLAPVLLLTWPPARSLTIAVLGGRGGVRPGIGQLPDGHWQGHHSAWMAPASVTDRLVAAAFARL